MPARIAPDATRGMIIAGGELDAGERGNSLLGRLLSRCGEQGRVLVLQLATDGDDLIDLETRLLMAGANEARVHTLATRGEASDAVLVDRLEHTDLLVIAPCSPLRLTSLIGGTALVRALRRRNADGMAVAAFGAVAAALSEHMLATGSEGLTPRSGGVSLAPGLGLSNRVLIDQGGQATDRLGRLLAALALNPFALGLGIDAGTAAVIGPDNVLEVLGYGGVTVIDPAEMADSNVAEIGDGAPIRITNLRLHALNAGTRFDLDFRTALP